MYILMYYTCLSLFAEIANAVVSRLFAPRVISQVGAPRYIYIYIYMYVYIYIYICISLSLYIYMYICMYECMYVSV